MGVTMRIVIGMCVFFGFISPLFAGEPCVEITSAQDILECALQLNPNVVEAQNERNRDEKLVNVARQRPNPEVDSQVLGGETADDTYLNTNTTLLHTVELGGKRKARVAQAGAQIDKSSAALWQNRETTALQTVLALYRLRQIKIELARVSETVSTFDKILRSFKERPTLTPEQGVSRASFELAREEYRLKRTVLVQEQSTLSHWLELATRVSYSHLAKYLPPFKNNWPRAPLDHDIEASGNSMVANARAEQKLAAANLKIAQSKAWPSLKIGPSFTTESLTNDTLVTGGVGLSVPIPILNLNRGEKAYAVADKSRADTNLDLTIRKATTDRMIQQQRYEAAVKALKQSRSAGHMSAQHDMIELYFERGLVPSILVIETHRQLYEITKTRNEQELTGIDALWRLYIIDGTVFEETI